MSINTRSSKDIERDIDDKRAAVADNIKQLKASLSLGAFAQLVGKVGLQYAGSIGASTLKQARKNPLPVATIGAGIAWLIFSNSKTHADLETPAGSEADPAPAPDSDRSFVSQTSTEDVQSTDKIDGSENGALNEFFEHHPFVVGALALAAGAALASTIPRSKTEDELLMSAQDLMQAEKEKLASVAQRLKDEAAAIITETKADLDSGAPKDQTAADAIGTLAKGATDRMMSAAVTAAKDVKLGER